MNENEDPNMPTTAPAQSPEIAPATPPQPTAPAAATQQVQQPAAPSQPAPPVTPSPVMPAPLTTPGSPAPQSNKKLFIIIGAIIAAVVIIGIIAWALYSTLFAIKKEDYTRAASLVSEVGDSGSESYSDVLKISYISSYSTATQVKNDAESAQKSFIAYKNANAKLKDAKALRDSEVKAAYEKYMKKYTAFASFSEPYITSAQKVLPAIATCEEITTASVNDVASFKVALEPCKEALNEAKSVPDADLKKFVSSYLDNIDNITKIVEEAAALPSTNYTRRSELRTELSESTDKLQDAQKNTNSDIEKRLKDTNPRTACNELNDIIVKKEFK